MSNSNLAIPHPELAPLIAALPSPPPPGGQIDIAALRAHLKNTFTNVVRKNLGPLLPPEDAYHVEEYTIPREGGEIATRTYRPAAEVGKTFPAMLAVHGGGFMHGDLDMEDYNLRIICVEVQIAIVNVDYRLAPENPYPAGLSDAYDALRWMAQNSIRLHADLHKGFIVSGKSSGGNMAAVLAHRAKADPVFTTNPLTGQILQMPALCHPDVVPGFFRDKLRSMEECKDAPILSREQMLNSYRILKADPSNPEISPLLYPSLANLAPAYMQVCGIDPCRDEALVYEEQLKANGVLTKLDIYPGAPHGFNAIFGRTEYARKWDKDYRAGLRWLLSLTVA
ncbi:Alpha/Beta hydrolase protein [Cubamyces lactineus]|nr:Alpha/Beta hydrolase protein [Cubamyces lactineus]